MKKVFIALSIAVLSLVACEQEKGGKDEVKDPITYTGDTQVVIEDGTNFYTVSFSATTNWEAALISPDADAVAGVTIDKTSGAAGEQSIKLTFEDLDESVTGRATILTVKAAGLTTEPKAGEAFTVIFMQGKVFLVDSSWLTIGREGGEASFNIYTNCDYTMKKYDAEDQAFPWAPVSVAGKTVIFNTEKNEGYDPRQAYVKFTVSDIQVEGEALVVRVYLNQEGNVSVAWSQPLTSVSSTITPGEIIRLGQYDGSIALSEKTKIHMLGAADGSLKSSHDYASTSMDVDDAGNIILVEAPIENEATGTVYRISLTSDPVKIVDFSNGVYGSTLSHFTVTGDVTKNAVICGQTNFYNYCYYSEIKDGVAGTPVSFALPTLANFETWGGINWNASRNGCVVPRGTTAADGFLYTVYDGSYCLFDIKADGTSSKIYEYDSEAGSNINFQCIDVCKWNGVNYAVLGLTTYFSWGDCPNFVLVNLDTKAVVSKFDHNNFEEIKVSYVGPNDGENASADIVLVPEKDVLGVVIADVLNNVIYRVDYPAAE